MAPSPPDGPGSDVPPAAEIVHLPGPSYLPVVVAFGIALALVGVVLSWVVSAIGATILVVGVVRWTRQARAETAALPLEH